MNEAAIFDLLEKIFKAVSDKEKAKPELSELNTALAAAQAEFEVAKRSRESIDYKERYGDLSDVVSASRPYLAKNGLGVTFLIDSAGDSGIMLSCILLHSSGQELRSSVRILPVKADPRSFVSEIALMKRCLYTALTGVCVEDEDDDGAGSMDNYRDAESKRALLSTKVDSREDKITINKDQLDDLEYELGDDHELAEKLLNSLGIRDLASMPKSKYRECVKKIRMNKEHLKKR